MENNTRPVQGQPSQMTCDNCGRSLGPALPTAPHKRFCGQGCRNEWHSRRRREALEQYDQGRLRKDQV